MLNIITCLCFIFVLRFNTFTELNYMHTGYGLTPFHIINKSCFFPTQKLPENLKVGETGETGIHRHIFNIHRPIPNMLQPFYKGRNNFCEHLSTSLAMTLAQIRSPHKVNNLFLRSFKKLNPTTCIYGGSERLRTRSSHILPLCSKTVTFKVFISSHA